MLSKRNNHLIWLLFLRYFEKYRSIIRNRPRFSINTSLCLGVAVFYYSVIVVVVAWYFLTMQTKCQKDGGQSTEVLSARDRFLAKLTNLSIRNS